MNTENYKLNEPSKEQIEAIISLKDNNIIVDSVAGSGKTTLCLHIAKCYQEEDILLLTYNAKLKMETRHKVELLGINNMEVHSYHSFCVKYYDHECITDAKMIQLLKREDLKPKRLISYQKIILDEAQDMSPLYYELICHILKDNGQKIKLCVLGDKNQSIFKFNNADERYITLGNRIFNNLYIENKWKLHKLSHSFRITNEMANFLNQCFLSENRLIAKKSNKKPKYIICDTFGDFKGDSNFYKSKKNNDDKVFEEVMRFLYNGYIYDDIFILAPSLKSKQSPARILANKLSENGIPIFVPVSDEEKLDDDLLRGKIVFSTFHQVKGLERKVVLVFNMDKSYFEFYNKDVNPALCPNEIYVACTRAQEQLILIHHYQNDFMPFLDKTKLEKYCEYDSDRLHLKKKSEKNIDTNVTDLIKHLPVEVLQKCLTFFDIEVVQQPHTKINIPLKTKQQNLYEGVTEITGIAIPTYFEFIKKGKMTIYDRCKDSLSGIEDKSTASKSLFSDEPKILQSDVEENADLVLLKKIDFKNLQTKDILYISNLWNSLKTGYIFKVNQIQKYDWLSKENLDLCMERLDKLVSNKLDTEVKFELENNMSSRNPELKNRKMIGIIDCIDKNNIWEFKCVAQLEDEHKIQLAIYMYLYKKENLKKKNTLIFNLMNLSINELEDDNEKKKKELNKKIKKSEEQLNFIEAMKINFDCNDSPAHQIEHMIDILVNDKVYHNCIIKKIYEDENKYGIILNDGKSKKKIHHDDIIRNYTLERMYMKMEKDILDLTVNIEKMKTEIKHLDEKQKEKNNKKEEEEMHYYLYNILDGHMLEIKSDMKKLESLVDYIIDIKFFTKNFIKDDEFIAKNEQIKNKIIN